MEGVLGANKRVYGIPYDADVVLEIDPETHALFIFGQLSRFGDSCKWYGGVLGESLCPCWRLHDCLLCVCVQRQ